MARPLTKPERRKLSEEVYRLSIQRVSQRQIAQRLNLSPKTVGHMVIEEMQRRKQDRTRADREREQSISTYEHIMGEIWSDLYNPDLKLNSLNRSGYYNSLIACQRSIDDVTGVKVQSENDTATAARVFLEGANMYREMAEERRRKGIRKQQDEVLEVEAEIVERPEPI